MEGQVLAFSAVHIPGVEKWQVDFLSCPHQSGRVISLPGFGKAKDIHCSLLLPWNRTTSWTSFGDPSICFCSRRLPSLFAITLPRRVWELANLSWKVPFLIFHKDKFVLRPRQSFLQKVMSSFHINVDIVLFFFRLGPLPTKEFALHSLCGCQGLPLCCNFL